MATKLRSSCNECRNNHLKCDGIGNPHGGEALSQCSRCARRGQTCIFQLAPVATPSAAQQHKNGAPLAAHANGNANGKRTAANGEPVPRTKARLDMPPPSKTASANHRRASISATPSSSAAAAAAGIASRCYTDNTASASNDSTSRSCFPGFAGSGFVGAPTDAVLAAYGGAGGAAAGHLAARRNSLTINATGTSGGATRYSSGDVSRYGNSAITFPQADGFATPVARPPHMESFDASATTNNAALYARHNSICVPPSYHRPSGNGNGNTNTNTLVQQQQQQQQQQYQLTNYAQPPPVQQHSDFATPHMPSSSFDSALLPAAAVAAHNNNNNNNHNHNHNHYDGSNPHHLAPPAAHSLVASSPLDPLSYHQHRAASVPCIGSNGRVLGGQITTLYEDWSFFGDGSFDTSPASDAHTGSFIEATDKPLPCDDEFDDFLRGSLGLTPLLAAPGNNTAASHTPDVDANLTLDGSLGLSVSLGLSSIVAPVLNNTVGPTNANGASSATLQRRPALTGSGDSSAVGSAASSCLLASQPDDSPLASAAAVAAAAAAALYHEQALSRTAPSVFALPSSVPISEPVRRWGSSAPPLSSNELHRLLSGGDS